MRFLYGHSLESAEAMESIKSLNTKKDSARLVIDVLLYKKRCRNP